LVEVELHGAANPSTPNAERSTLNVEADDPANRLARKDAKNAKVGGERQRKGFYRIRAESDKNPVLAPVRRSTLRVL
jgi:hypothetical protein